MPLQEPPRTSKRLRFSRLQLVGMIAMAAVPILAMAGVFSPRSSTLAARSDAIEIEVKYSNRARLSLALAMDLKVTNVSAETIDDVRVSFDESYLSAFTSVSMTPSPETVTPDATVVHLGDMGAGEAKAINIELKPASPWHRQGKVRASAERGPGAEVTLSTWVLP